jgi:hypothetical protein
MKKITKKQSSAIVPDWVPEKEKIGTAMYQAGQEFLLAVEEVLMKEFDFTEKNLKLFHQKLENILKVTREAEGMGLSCIGLDTMRAISEIAEMRLLKETANRSGILLPTPNKQEIVKRLMEAK